MKYNPLGSSLRRWYFGAVGRIIRSEGLPGMGEKQISTKSDDVQMRAFTKAVLNDLNALQEMLDGGKLEQDKRRIGAEQEIFLLDSSMRPAPLAVEVIDAANDPRLTTEIGRFNLEANLTPRCFTGDALRKLENELLELIGIVKAVMRCYGGNAVLCGILPTIQLSDLVEANLTPAARYIELNRVLTALHGDDRLVHIKGLDEIQLHLRDTYIEFCNTSFQVHLQVPVGDFSRYYNWAQAVTAPVLASAVNSPLLLGHRLWHETRLALFQHAVDERSPMQHERSRPARVTFGREWVGDSILDVFHEDVARFRVILTRSLDENSRDVLRHGNIPGLHAWRMHNGTIWRWNRPCYGILNGVPGLRIEARYLPAGPTVIDEMANAAFFVGLVNALPEEYGEVSKLLSFDDAKTNFFSAARYGIRSQMTWIDGKLHRTQQLILDDLIPAARRGLVSAGIASDDIERYLGVLADRVQLEKTGSQWVLDSLAAMEKGAKQNVRMRTLTSAMLNHQETGEPMHKWELAAIDSKSEWIDNFRTVEQFMSRDLFTVRPDDLLDLAASLMDWKHLRHVPVEDENGDLVGIISHRDLLRLLAVHENKPIGEQIVRDVMKTNLITITPETKSLDALYLMREKNIGCLPICRGRKLVGLITAYDFLTVSTRLFEERLKEQGA